MIRPILCILLATLPATEVRSIATQRWREHVEFLASDAMRKVVVYLNGGPKSVTEPRRSQAQFAGERWARLRQRGAIGIVAIRNPARAEGPWEQNAAQRFNPGMSLADAAVDERQGERL